MNAEPKIVERLLRRDRQIVLTALVLVTVLTWVYTISGSGTGVNAFEMTFMPGVEDSNSPITIPQSAAPAYFLVLLTMWWVMMIAMMLPAAAPTILLAAALNRRSAKDQPPYGSTINFALGYLLAWLFFSILAAAGQLAFESHGLLSAKMQSNRTWLTGGLLLLAGIWQFTPIKQACLRHCRSPVEFLTRRRRPGNTGALVMGLEHGTYCLGCCWFLMVLLFVGGVMSLYWIAGLALFVLVEKLFSRGIWFGRVTGAGLILAGAALLVV